MKSGTTATSHADACNPNGSVALTDEELSTVTGGLSTLQIYLALWNAAMPVKIYIR